MSEQVVLESLRAAAKAVAEAAERRGPSNGSWLSYERARAEFWRLYAKWLNCWIDGGSSENLTVARAIAAEVEARR